MKMVTSSEDRILIQEIEFLGHCGVPETERNALQRFSVSVELCLDLIPAAITGNLQKSVDYEDVANFIVSIGKNQSYILLESMAEEMSSGVLKRFAVHSVKIQVKKLAPPVEVIRGFFAVEIFRKK